ncbi:sulfotransferase family protein [Rubrivirga marina]|uniref:Sulfotransferase domain-containing protein n=1 Tax=Rubrivirga marina TaxID=1196024 RepID=A0A271IYC2_9BACT|nr:sulfotransferase [Rubrivirga marina]PAP75958.1 hypothetical protein BSZ37_05645 [Rubrivirga marina]
MPTSTPPPRPTLGARDRLPPPIRSALSAGKRAAWFSIGRMTPVPTRPVLVLGNQKAGTTAVAALLAQYAGLSATLDFRYLTSSWLKGVHDGSIPFQAFLRRHALDFSRGLVKEPNLSLLYPHLVRAFPEAEVVLIVRDPRDNIRSVLNRLGLPGDAPPPEGWADRVNPLWRLVVDGAWLGLEGGTHVEALASRWSAIADVALDHADRVRLIRYEDFMADKEGAVADLAARCGLEQKADIADRLNVAFQPRGDRAVSWTSFFGDDALRRLDTRCGDRLAAFGYPSSIEAGPPADPAPSPPLR